jgi:CRP-like cAMP-binding protein
MVSENACGGLIWISIACRAFRHAMAVGLAGRHHCTGRPVMAETGASLSIQTSPFARKLACFVRLTDADLSVLSDIYRRRRSFEAGRDMIYQGETGHSAYILASGWACSYKILPGGTRQIVDFQIPGDFLGLRSVLFRTADHNVEPITAVQASQVQRADLLMAFGQTPRLATAILWAASRDEAMVVEHLVDLGRRNAAERMAHFLLELGARLRLVGMGGKGGYACPLTQYLLADALGLSAIHVNRVLRELREEGLLTFQKGMVTFDDYDALVEFAGFDRGYLDHEGPLLP